MSDETARARAALGMLDETLTSEFDPDAYGLPWYRTLEDRSVRAIRSNQAIGLVDAAVAHLDALEESARQVRALVGPNGRTMPTPDEVEARRALDRVHVEITDGLRAAGSLLDVLGGLVVLFLGLPVSPPFADSRQLLRCEPEPESPTTEQAALVGRIRAVVRDLVAARPNGWLEWTVESRNAMVHRGRSMTVWMPIPSAVPHRKIVVVTKRPPQQVTRQFPHLRRRPDLTDAESVLEGGKFDEVFLHEPAQVTLEGLTLACAELARGVANELHSSISSLANFAWPANAWSRRPRTARAITSDDFRGFDVSYEAATATSLHLNPRDAKRLLTMERIRVQESGA